MKQGLLFLGAGVALVLIFMFSIFGYENRAITLEESVKNQESVIETMEKERFDLIPNLVEVVKKYSEYEAQTLENIIKQRSGNSLTNAQMDEIKNIINVAVEQYPNLKADQQYLKLMDNLTLCENKIANSRNEFNKAVTEYKKYVKKFPNRIFLSITGYDIIDFQRLVFENNSVDAPKINL